MIKFEPVSSNLFTWSNHRGVAHQNVIGPALNRNLDKGSMPVIFDIRSERTGVIKKFNYDKMLDSWKGFLFYAMNDDNELIEVVILY